MVKVIKSEQFGLIWHDVRSILIGAAIMGGGVAAQYALEGIMKVDFGQWSPIISMACSILINVIKKGVTASVYVK